MDVRLYQGLIEFNWNLLFSAITVIVLFFILKHFFFEKVHNFMVERERAVQDSLDNAAETIRQADEKLADYNARIANAEDDVRKIMEDAKHQAELQASKIVDEAKQDAVGIMEHTQREIEREQHNARAEMKDEITTLAMMAAQQIMEKELDPKGHEEIVDKIIEEAGNESWQN
ncbi:MAG TPA: F0F1 ATP synthase subunit B [Anaerovoracaceae bacterium]|nr:F0F1 ATP synthase subunit B [Anaerovoracaceae bacterium]